MDAVVKRPRVDDDREAQLLDAAIHVLAEVGYDRLTMDAVALQAKASKATLYRRWPSKAELVVDAVSCAKGMPDPTPAPDTGSLRGDLLTLSCGPDGMADRLPLSVLGGLMTALHTDPTLSAAWRERFLAPRLAVVHAAFQRAVERGEVSAAADLSLLEQVVPSMCTFRSTVLGRRVDETFVAAVIDAVVLPAAASPAHHDAKEKQ
jgi:AcrR family transcriptional regulator